jgi:ubiquinone/menaquinone biosynthesis C-methylase UbiE
MKQETSWGAVAGWYDELLGAEGTYQKEVILPNLTRIIAPRPGLEIADIACGQGFFSRAFADLGADVTATDISAELVALAKAKGGEISYEVAPSHELPMIADKSVDTAVIVLAIQNIKELQKTFDEAARILRPKGIFVLVLNHPAFRNPKHTSWGFDEAGKSQYRRIDQYVSESHTEIDMTPGKPTGKVFTISFHRPLQVYFKALRKAGFAVSRLEEWNSHKKSEPGPRQAMEDKARKEIPLFLCLEALKLEGSAA